MHWHTSHRFHAPAVQIANRHYSRQKPDSPQFVKPGSCLVYITPCRTALWVTSWQEHIDHEWKDAWECSTFRNEGRLSSSLLIRQALAATRYEYGEPPPGGMITMVNPAKVPGHFHRGELRWGYCYWKAGFEFAGWTGSGKYVLRLRPELFPPAEPARGVNHSLLSHFDAGGVVSAPL